MATGEKHIWSTGRLQSASKVFFLKSFSFPGCLPSSAARSVKVWGCFKPLFPLFLLFLVLLWKQGPADWRGDKGSSRASCQKVTGRSPWERWSESRPRSPCEPLRSSFPPSWWRRWRRSPWRSAVHWWRWWRRALWGRHWTRKRSKEDVRLRAKTKSDLKSLVNVDN